MQVIRLPDGRSYEKAVPHADGEAIPRRGQTHLIKDLGQGTEVPVHGVSGLGTDRTELIFVRHLEVPDIHRLQSLGWKLQKQ
ncbi:MAG TPA: hypothetical protein VNU25_01735 [Candidatus Paceibacterota bacterium]|nr:hypothetical protein [Candidatus Paceibacterota bacterium]